MEIVPTRGAKVGSLVWREITRPRVVVTSLLTALLFGLLPSWWAFGGRHSYLLEFPAALFDYLHRDNLLFLIFPLAATFPYVVHVLTEIQHRYLSYARLRVGVRQLLWSHFLSNAVVSFSVFFLIGLIPQFFVQWGPVTNYRPEGADLFTPEAISAAEQGYSTLSQLAVHGPWAYPLAYAAWLALNAVLYSSMALCALVWISHRVVALVVVWISTVVCIYVMAVLGLEMYSPALYAPFNLTQLPMSTLIAPGALVGGLCVILVSATLAWAPRLHRLQ